MSLAEDMNGLAGELCNNEAYACTHQATLESIRLLIEGAKEIEELENPGWHGFIEACERFMEHYPPDIFTGASGDSGSLFVVALRKALSDLAAASPTEGEQ